MEPRPAEPEGSIVASWAEAPRLARERARAALARAPVAIIGITGPVASGKTTLARQLSDTILSTDDYLPDYEEVDEHLRDHPDAADLGALAGHLASLRSGRATLVPVWSFHTHRRESEREVAPTPLIVCEGLHALHERIAHLLDVRIFIEAPRSVRLARLAAREQTGERGWGVEKATRFFHEVAEPTYARFAPDYRARAHILVRGEQE